MLDGLEYECLQGNVDAAVTEVSCDSRTVGRGALFICIPGAKFDGHDFAVQAVERGAAALVVSGPVKEAAAEEAVQILVKDTRYAMAFISAAWYGHPARRLKTIGITGTKGKTTTAYMVRSILENAGFRTGLVGTIEIIIGDRSVPAGNTTPESCVLQEIFSEMVQAGTEIVVMEVSSQALMQHRTQGFLFDYGVFTNLEPDHIGPGEHASFEEYAACKGLLFRQCAVGIVNGDDACLEAVTAGHTCRLETFGMGEDCMLRGERPKPAAASGALGTGFHVSGEMDFDAWVPFPGRFSVYNALCAIAVCRHFQADIGAIRRGLEETRVKGRIERVPVSDRFTLLIDYAHNAMALESLLTTLREYHPRRLICLFGCGGNRSRQRRYEMGEASGRLADLTIITSDNPRMEDPAAIMADIHRGISGTRGAYVEIQDRREAVAYAISQAQEGDIIVLAGKGHEDYQEIRGRKYPMDERVIIRELLDGGLEHI